MKTSSKEVVIREQRSDQWKGIVHFNCVFIVYLTETLRQSNVKKRLSEKIDLQISCKRALFHKERYFPDAFSSKTLEINTDN